MLAILLAVFFHPVVTGSMVLFYRDVLTFHFPIWASTAADFHASGFPLWNPRIQFGQPTLGNPNYLLCYPPAWIRFVMESVASYHLFILFHLFAGGLAFFLLIRSWDLSPQAGFWGAVIYTFSGINLSLTCVLNLVPYVALVPAAMWALGNLIRTRRVRWASTLAVILALVVTVFEPVMVAALGLVFLLQLGMAWKPFETGGRRWPLPGLCLLSVILAALLAGPMLWEGVWLARSAHRPAADGADTTLYSQNPLLSLEMFLPNPLGFSFEDKNEFRGARFYGSRNPYLVSVYLGLGLLPLAGMGLIAPRSRRAWLLLAGFLVFLFLSWGGHMPGLLSAMQWLPLLSWARYPQKFMIPASLLFILLGTIGLHRLFGSTADEARPDWKNHGWIALPLVAVLGSAALVPEFSLRNLVPWGVLALAAVFGSIAAGWRWSKTRRWACHIAGLLLTADLMLANGFAVPLAPADTLRSPVPLFAAIQRDGTPPGAYRIAVEPHPAVVPGGGNDALWYMLFLKNAGLPYFGMTQGVQYAFDLMLDQTQTREMNLLREEYLRRPLDQRVRLMQRLGVRFLISRNSYTHPGLDVVRAEPLAPGCVFKVYRIADARARLAFYPAAAEDASPSPAAAIDRLAGLPPDQTLVTDSVLAPDVGRLRTSGRSGPASFPSIVYAPGRLTAEVSSPAAGILVLRECLAAGWSAVVDGKPAPVRRADAFFLGVVLPPGQHRVEFRYRPTALPWLLAVSLVASMGALAGILFGDRLEKRLLPHRQPDHDGR